MDFVYFVIVCTFTFIIFPAFFIYCCRRDLGKWMRNRWEDFPKPPYVAFWISFAYLHITTNDSKGIIYISLWASLILSFYIFRYINYRIRYKKFLTESNQKIFKGMEAEEDAPSIYQHATIFYEYYPYGI